MKLWIDAQLSPALANWISATFAEVDAVAVRDLGLRDAEDSAIFMAARQQDAVVMTKDSDFVELQKRLGAPPKLIWITYGNTSNAKLKSVLQQSLLEAIKILAHEDLVEITGV